ncbi:MAG: hypothetical protein NVSMB19_07760 [Vulcanimicrobiaceae bacterium]
MQDDSRRDGDAPFASRTAPGSAIGVIADTWNLLVLIELSRVDVLRYKALQRTLGTVS